MHKVSTLLIAVIPGIILGMIVPFLSNVVALVVMASLVVAVVVAAPRFMKR